MSNLNTLEEGKVDQKHLPENVEEMLRQNDDQAILMVD